MRVKKGGCKFKREERRVGVMVILKKLFKGTIFFFWALRAACEISETKNNHFWEKSKVPPQIYPSGG